MRNGMPLTCAGIAFLKSSREKMRVAVSCTRVQRCNQVHCGKQSAEGSPALAGCMIGSSVYSCLQNSMLDHYGIIWQVGGTATRSASSSANLRYVAQVSRCRSMGLPSQTAGQRQCIQMHQSRQLYLHEGELSDSPSQALDYPAASLSF